MFDPSRLRKAILPLSAAICAVVAFLILGPRPAWVAGAMDVSWLPAVNASLNALSGLLLVCGFVAIKTRRRKVHQWLMLSAFASSTCFLVTYVVYHWFKAGPAVYQGAFRGAYLFVLLTHICLAVVILPLALNTLSLALANEIARHRRIAPWTLGLWLYVSATGVLIYALVHA